MSEIDDGSSESELSVMTDEADYDLEREITDFKSQVNSIF